MSIVIYALEIINLKNLRYKMILERVKRSNVDDKNIRIEQVI